MFDFVTEVRLGYLLLKVASELCIIHHLPSHHISCVVTCLIALC